MQALAYFTAMGAFLVKELAISRAEIVYKEMERVADPEAYLDRCNHYSWLGRGGQPEEVGTAALFLASSWAGYITGVTLNVSGGMEFGTIPKYYAFDASAEKMKNNTQEEN